MSVPEGGMEDRLLELYSERMFLLKELDLAVIEERHVLFVAILTVMSAPFLHLSMFHALLAFGVYSVFNLWLFSKDLDEWKREVYVTLAEDGRSVLRKVSLSWGS